MTYKEQLKGKQLEVKSAKIVCPDGELIDLELINNNNDTIDVLDTVHNTVQEELRKEWRREMNKMLWKMGSKR